MAGARAENTSVRAALPSREVRVVNWPLRDDPMRAVGALCVCCAVGILAGYVARSWQMGCLAALALAGAMWRLWVPVTCDLGPQGMTLAILRWRRRIAWREITRIEDSGRGILIHAEPAASSGGILRSIYLPWGRHRELVYEFHAYYGPRPTAREVVDGAAGRGVTRNTLSE